MYNVKDNLAKNLVILRKNKDLTQLELAVLLNYSDKAISKWECGDATPDIEVLSKLADFYGVTLDCLVRGDGVPQPKKCAAKDTVSQKSNKIIITFLAVSIVWFCATLIQIQLKITLNYQLGWLLYIWAVPATFIIFIVFNGIWGQRRFSSTLVSCLVWTLLASLYLQFLVLGHNIWMIFFIGIPVQIAAVLWSQLLKNRKKQRETLDE